MSTLEFLKLEARNALSTPNLTESVYKKTTYEKPKNKRTDLFAFPWQRAQDAPPQETVEDEEDSHLRHFNNLPSRTPVDLQFKDISYFVESGIIKKSKLLCVNVTTNNYDANWKVVAVV